MFLFIPKTFVIKQITRYVLVDWQHEHHLPPISLPQEYDIRLQRTLKWGINSMSK